MKSKKSQYLLIVLLVSMFLSAGCVPKKPLQLTEEMVLNQPFPQQTKEHYVYPFDQYRMEILKEISNPDDAAIKAAQKAVDILRTEALREAAEEINEILDKPLSSAELSARVKKASTIHGKFVELKSLKTVIEEKDFKPKAVVLTGYIKVSRPALKEFMVDAVKSTELSITESDVLTAEAPVSTSKSYVVTFKDVVREVSEKLSDRKKAHTQAVNWLLESLKRKALKEAALEVNHSLAQPMDQTEFDYAIEKANRNFQDYITDWKLTQKVLDTTKTYLGTKESVRIGGWFAVDKEKLQRTLVDDRAITAVSKYRTYVEAFWNVPGKEINPEVVEIMIGNVEDHFTQKGYEIVQFERIKGDLVELLDREGEKIDDLFSQDELAKFEANLDLRNVDSKFVNGKRILANYADLLIGVTINSMVVRDRMVRVRVTINATLFENGEWRDLAHQDGMATAPYVRGDTDTLIAVTKRVTQDTVALLETKTRKQIALRKSKEEIRVNEEREFTLVFRKADKRMFNNLKKKLKNGQDWVFKGADTKNNTVRLGYRGTIDDLADGVDDFLGGFDIRSGMPEYSRGQNLILFGGEGE